VVYSLSRLARSTKDAITISERLEKGGADLVSLSERIDTTTAAGKMVFRMLAVLAELERDQISERTKAALAHKRALRQRVGTIPYGFTLGGDRDSLVPVQEEQEAIQLMRTLRDRGMSYRRVATELERLQVPAKNGGRRRHFQIVRDVLRREAA
jgi:site-specific DNA recombinase